MVDKGTNKMLILQIVTTVCFFMGLSFLILLSACKQAAAADQRDEAFHIHMMTVEDQVVFANPILCPEPLDADEMLA